MIDTDDPILHRDLMLKSVLCFGLQISLIYLIYYDPYQQHENQRTNYLEVNIARLISSIILHLVVMHEIADSINLMQYSINKFETFQTQSFIFPFLIASMKLLGSFFTELLSMQRITSAFSVEDVVKDFVAFIIISEIDDIIGRTLKATDLKDSIDNQNIYYERELEDKGFFEHCNKFLTDMNCGDPMLKTLEMVFQFIAMVIYKLIVTVYIIFYFYFFPLISILFVFFYFPNKKYEVHTINLYDLIS